MRDPQIRRKLALGKHFEALSLTEEEEKAIKEDLIRAKKYENEINERVTRKIENEELQKLLQESDDTRSSNAKMQAYYNKLHQIQIQAEAKLKKQIHQAEEFEIKKLQEDQQRLLDSEAQKLLEGRKLFEESEKKRKEIEKAELDKRDNWRVKEDDKSLEMPQTTPSKKRDLISLLQTTSQQSKYSSACLFELRNYRASDFANDR